MYVPIFYLSMSVELTQFYNIFTGQIDKKIWKLTQSIAYVSILFQ